MRDWLPRTTWPLTAGAPDSSATSYFCRSPPASGECHPELEPEITRTPRRSPSTTATNLRFSPTGRSLNSARPESSVFTVSRLSPGLHFHREVGDVVREVAANQTDGDCSIRQIASQDAGCRTSAWGRASGTEPELPLRNHKGHKGHKAPGRFVYRCSTASTFVSFVVVRRRL